MIPDRFIFRLFLLLVGLILLLPMSSSGSDFPMEVTDAAQNKLRILEKPQRVVSLVPYITEMLLAFGQDRALVGLSSQDLTLRCALRKKMWAVISPPILKLLPAASRI